jgi:hypothetical protein
MRLGTGRGGAVGMVDGAPIEFERVAHVPDGGALSALPVLLLYGLLHKSREVFSTPEGFYPLESVFLLLAFLALARIPSLEALPYVAPWGMGQGKAVPQPILFAPAHDRFSSKTAVSLPKRRRMPIRHDLLECFKGAITGVAFTIHYH